MQIDYFEKDGSLWFSCREEVFSRSGGHRIFRLSDKVPPQVVGRGAEAIRVYAERRVEREIGEQKRRAAEHDQFEQNPEFPVEVRYRGDLLQGRIVSAKNRNLVVDLREPYRGRKLIHYGWMSPDIFDGENSLKFSAHAIATAQGLLVEIYQEEEHRSVYQDTIALADELNDGRKVRPPFHPKGLRE